MGVQVVVHPSAGAFLNRAEAWLLASEAEHNLVLSIASNEAASDEPDLGALWATVERSGEVVGAAFRTPPHKLCVSRMPLEAVGALVDAVASRFERIPAVLGPVDVAEAAAQEWVDRCGGSWTPGMRQRIYRLDTVIPAAPVPGAVRLARADEVEQVVEWAKRFAADTDPQFTVPEDQVRAWVDEGGVFVWDDAGAVSMARAVGGTHQGIRVGFVYTPPDRRKRGYATALVAEVSRIVLEMGHSFCVLYTDLSNPTSNSIYKKIGYVPLVDVVDADIHSPGFAQRRGM